MQTFVVDHITPRSRGGPTELQNLALACPGCNAHKYNKVQVIDPLTGVSGPLFHPRGDRWKEHFVWNADFTLIIGLTPSGRATVAALCMNRDGAVNLRRLLQATGMHPPVESGE